MTTKIHGAAYKGIWVERKVSFVKLTFSVDISALAQADLYLLGTTTPPSATTVADSTFGVVESALVQALKVLETKATVLAISDYDSGSKSVDVMLGNSEGWFSNVNGVIASGLPVTGAQAVVTTGGITPTTVLGSLVTVRPAAVTFGMKFAYLDGTLPVATEALGALVTGPGATPGSDPPNSPTGTAGWYPVPV